MQDIPQETLSETTKAEQSAKVDLWEFDLTAIGGERFFFCNEPNEKGEPLTWQGGSTNRTRYRYRILR